MAIQLVSMGEGTGVLKAGFLGFAGSGKTFTAAELAIIVRKHFKLEGPVAMFDTEAAAQYIAPKVLKATGKKLLGFQGRALSDSIEFIKLCMAQGVSVAIIDSVTHLWREVCKSYLDQVNAKRTARGLSPRKRMEFQDWNEVKQTWGTFSDLYLNCPLHVIICGRAGYEYDFETDDEGKKELIKTGIKMKTEGEFGFEPSLLVQMDRVQVTTDAGKLTSKFIHRASILKDRFGVIDGKEFDDPKCEAFQPYLDCLTPGTLAAVDTMKQTDMGIGEDGSSEMSALRRKRAQLCEEIQGVITVHFPGQSAEEKRSKAIILHRTFGTYSWEVIQGMNPPELVAGLAKLAPVIEAIHAEVKAVADSEKAAANEKAAKKAEKAAVKS